MSGFTPERIAELRLGAGYEARFAGLSLAGALAVIEPQWHEMLDEIERLQALVPQWQAEDGDIGRFQHVLVAVRAATGDPGPFVQEADADDISDLLSDGYVIYAWAPMVDPPDPKRFA